MYRFQISAVTQPGERIALVGSIPEMGSWDVVRCVWLRTSSDRYPLWWVELDFARLADRGDRPQAIEYKYARIGADGSIAWEAWGVNRWVPVEPHPLPGSLIVDDGQFGVILPHPYGYYAKPTPPSSPPPEPGGLKVVVLGSSVALGCSAWLLQGWTWHLERALRTRYGHQLVNVSELGGNVTTTIARFQQVVPPHQPDIVLIALSLGNEGLATCAPSQRPIVQQQFEDGLQHLIQLVRDLGARPLLGGVYPNNGYTSEHYGFLRSTHKRMLNWGVPVLDWLPLLEDGQGRWQTHLFIDAAHPNTDGHRHMFEAIDLALFRPTPPSPAEPVSTDAAELLLYQDSEGFCILFCTADQSVRITNPTPYSYTITPEWQSVQAALRTAHGEGSLRGAGLYVSVDPTLMDSCPAAPITSPLQSLFLENDGAIATTFTLPASSEVHFYPIHPFFARHRSKVLFYNGNLALLSVGDRRLYVFNESTHEYNIHPMWKEVRAALKAMPSGVYDDPTQPDAPFRTLMIGQDGLESRVKAPARSALLLDYRCSLAEVNRVAILPLGDRCAARMLLYKLEYDGPAFPFDLTRTTNLGNVADIIHSGFQDMWNPAYLHYNHDQRRIYHTKWTGLSFAHEVDESDNPLYDMSPIFERMRVRYTARSKRFWYTLQASDKALFIRTGVCDRGEVMDLVHKLETKYQGKPFLLLLLSPQSSDEFAHLPNVLHYNLEFNPDRMYDDVGYWMECTDTMRTILNSLGISSKNLFWCPPNPPEIAG